MATWYKIEKPWHKLSIHLILFNKIDIFAGRSDSWGISAEYNPYDRSIVLKILNLYIGFDVWHKDLGDAD